CGGAESVNCKLSNSSSQSGPCDKTDIHVPLVEVATDDQWKSVVVEPISQGRPTASGKVTTGKNVGEWTPPFFDKLKDDNTKIRVRGGLFYDGEHLVNRNPNAPRDDEPKRITLWEIHPLTEILIC